MFKTLEFAVKAVESVADFIEQLYKTKNVAIFWDIVLRSRVVHIWTTLRYIPVDGSIRKYCRENLKPYTAS
jgi:hypothetical protein